METDLNFFLTIPSSSEGLSNAACKRKKLGISFFVLITVPIGKFYKVQQIRFRDKVYYFNLTVQNGHADKRYLLVLRYLLYSGNCHGRI